MHCLIQTVIFWNRPDCVTTYYVYNTTVFSHFSYWIINSWKKYLKAWNSVFYTQKWNIGVNSWVTPLKLHLSLAVTQTKHHLTTATCPRITPISRVRYLDAGVGIEYTQKLDHTNNLTFLLKIHEIERLTYSFHTPICPEIKF